jgi:hypothetical protein
MLHTKSETTFHACLVYFRKIGFVLHTTVMTPKTGRDSLYINRILVNSYAELCKNRLYETSYISCLQ